MSGSFPLAYRLLSLHSSTARVGSPAIEWLPKYIITNSKPLTVSFRPTHSESGGIESVGENVAMSLPFGMLTVIRAEENTVVLLAMLKASTPPVAHVTPSPVTPYTSPEPGVVTFPSAPRGSGHDRNGLVLRRYTGAVLSVPAGTTVGATVGWPTPIV